MTAARIGNHHAELGRFRQHSHPLLDRITSPTSIPSKDFDLIHCVSYGRTTRHLSSFSLCPVSRSHAQSLYFVKLSQVSRLPVAASALKVRDVSNFVDRRETTQNFHRIDKPIVRG